MARGDVAGLVVARLDGEGIGADFERYLNLVREGVGGFIVFGGEASTLREGLGELQKAAGRRLIVASDLEQGLGQQVRGGTIFPTALGIGTGLDPDQDEDRGLVREAAGVVAREARSVGINLVLAPVCDVATNPDNPVIGYRSFGATAETVARIAALWVEGLQTPPGSAPGERWPWACAKHFPGHGDTARDSHLELPVLRHTAERLFSVEIPPFEAAVRAGVRVVMTGHLRVEAIDPEAPASLSREVVEGLLRKRLGFQGLVITDALNMGGITEETAEDEAGVRALAAGTDILLHPSDPEGFIDALRGRARTIAPFVERSLGRLEGFVAELPPSPPTGEDPGIVGSEEHRGVADRVAGRVVRVSGRSPVMRGEEICLVLDDDGEEDTADALIEELSKDYGCLDLRKLGPSSFSDPGDLAGKATVVMLFSRVRGWKGRSGVRPELETFIRHLRDTTAMRTAVIFGMPGIDRHFPDTPARVYAYGTDESVQRHVARVLAGGNKER